QILQFILVELAELLAHSSHDIPARPSFFVDGGSHRVKRLHIPLNPPFGQWKCLVFLEAQGGCQRSILGYSGLVRLLLVVSINSCPGCHEWRLGLGIGFWHCWCRGGSVVLEMFREFDNLIDFCIWHL